MDSRAARPLHRARSARPHPRAARGHGRTRRRRSHGPPCRRRLRAHALPGLGARGELVGYWLDLSHPQERAAVLSGERGVALGAMAHTLEMYRRLHFGWRTTPQGIPTDRYMQQQFLGEPSCRAVSGTRRTYLHFESRPRAGWSAAQRLAELGRWREKLFDERGRAEFYCAVVDLLAREHVAAVRGFEDSLSWRLRSRLLDWPFVARLVRSAARGGGRRPPP